MIDDKILRSYRTDFVNGLDDEQLRKFRDLMIENIESTGSARIQDLVLIELVSRELARRAFGGFFAPDIDKKVIVDTDWKGIEIENEIEVPKKTNIEVTPRHKRINRNRDNNEATTITGGKAITDVTFGDQEDWKKTVIDDFGGD